MGTMEKLDIIEKQLQDLLTQTTNQLNEIGIQDVETGDWIVKTTDIDQSETDVNNQADAAEEADSRVTILAELENRYRLITHTLKKFAEGTYGLCEIAGTAIEPERLEANPIARTCTEHMEEESTLPAV